ncbi:MAG TPA: hypothetical protein EYP23_00605 [Thermoplasmata archaeon]|nr:hypothetical protein [Thermoplasmata archaeon]
MREYKIKKGYKPDLNKVLSKYFCVSGDVEKGFYFDAEGFGRIFIQQKGSSLFIETKPSQSKSVDYSVIKKWNDFLYEATGKTAKERKKEFSKL